MAVVGSGGHIIVTGHDGRLHGTTPAELDAILARVRQSREVVVHLHGGLVDESRGLKIANRLTNTYLEAGADPVFIVWRSGLLEILEKNISEIAREQLFSSLLSRIVQFSVGKFRQTPGQRGGLSVPTDMQVDAELNKRRSAEEPYADIRVPSDLADVTEEEAMAVEDAVSSDDVLTASLTEVLAGRHPERTETTRGVTLRREVSSKSLIDPDALEEIDAGSAVPGQRGLISTAMLAKKAAGVFVKVIGRFRSETDHGLYTTVVEELLREFYLANAGGSIWSAIKGETASAFAAEDRVGCRLLSGLVAPGAIPYPRITLVGHSTGAVYIDNLLAEVARGISGGYRPWPQTARFRVALLAPANTYSAFAPTLSIADKVVDELRVFTMTDSAERSDKLVGPIYPRSLLFFVSGVLERDRSGASIVVPITGLSRYLGPRYDEVAELQGPRLFLRDRIVLSPTNSNAPVDRRATALHHGDFDDDECVLTSLQAMIRQGR